MDHLWETSATDDIISETDSKIAHFVKQSNMLLLEFANAIWLKVLWCPHVYNSYVCNVIFVKGLLQSISHNMRAYWSSYRTSYSQKLANHATSLTKLQAAARPGERPAVYTDNRHKLNILYPYRRWGTIKNIGSPSNTSFWRSCSGEGAEVPPMDDDGAASLLNSTQLFSICSTLTSLTKFRILQRA